MTASAGAAGSSRGGAGQASGGRGEAGRAGMSGSSAAGAGAGGAGGQSSALPATERVYVSGYGPNIRVLTLDTATGKLSAGSQVSGGNSPSYMAFTPDQKFAYAVNEGDAASSVAIAFAIDPADGHLTELNRASTRGAGAPHLAVDPSGKWLAVAHYSSGETSIIPIGADGKLGTASAPDKGPDGSCKNAHQAVFDQSGKYLLVPCLGSDYVLQYKIDNGQLSYNTPATIAVEKGSGPRHIALDPEEKFAYLLTEYGSTITWFAYDSTTGTLSNPQVIDSFQREAGASAHIVVHPSGKWLYASNRKENTLGRFSIDASSGQPKAEDFISEQIATPRDFSIDPTGTFLILANQAGAQDVLVFRIAPQDGKLTRTHVFPVGDSPTFTQALIFP